MRRNAPPNPLTNVPLGVFSNGLEKLACDHFGPLRVWGGHLDAVSAGSVALEASFPIARENEDPLESLNCGLVVRRLGRSRHYEVLGRPGVTPRALTLAPNFAFCAFAGSGNSGRIHFRISGIAARAAASPARTRAPLCSKSSYL